MHIATRMGHDQIVRMLLKAGCDVNIQTHQGLNALTIAASCNNLSIARLLLEHRAHIQGINLWSLNPFPFFYLKNLMISIHSIL